ncbi:hypothetical protein HY625_02525 [Candidatus Uhrbacteria bacterium]|nr:hypothetical protein [Candidatus Uhrbacteria bacterium]
MEKRINFLLGILPAFLTFLLLLGTVVFLFFFLTSTWQALDTTQTILTLKEQVATESLNRSRFDRVLAGLKAKTANRTIDWKKLHNPF